MRWVVFFCLVLFFTVDQGVIGGVAMPVTSSVVVELMERGSSVVEDGTRVLVLFSFLIDALLQRTQKRKIP